MASFIYSDDFDSFSQCISIDEINTFESIDSKTLLQIAIDENKSNFFEFMIKKVIDLNTNRLSQAKDNIKILLNKRLTFLKNEFNAGYSRLHVAIIDDEPEVVHYMLSNSLCNPNNLDVPIGTPLHLAILLGRLNCINALMKYDIDVDIVSKHQQTPLEMAIIHDIHSIHPQLFSLSTNIDGRRYMGLTFLQLAIIHDWKHLIPILVDVGADVYEVIQEEIDISMVSIVTQHGHLSPIIPLSSVENCLSICLKLNGDIYPCMLEAIRTDKINTTDGHGNTLLHLAAALQNAELCELLLAKGANVNFYNNSGKNALQHMLSMITSMKHSVRKPVAVGTILVNAGVDVNMDEWNDNNIIKDVLLINHEKFFLLVLENTTVLDFSTIDLKSLVKRKWFSVTCHLFNRMPSVLRNHAVNNDMVQLYLKNATIEEMNLLIAHFNVNQLQLTIPLVLDYLADHGDLVTFSALVDKSIQTPGLLTNGETILTNLIKQDKQEFIQAILQSNCRDVYISMKNKSELSALHAAIAAKNTALIDILILEYGDFNTLDPNGDTIFSLLFKRFNESSDIGFVEKTAKIMINGGATPHIKDKHSVDSIKYCCDVNIASRIIAFAQKKQTGLINMKNDTECKVCLSRPVQYALECGHVYCNVCVRKCTRCPSCRMPSNSIRKIFF